jgi:hypothetical protein
MTFPLDATGSRVSLYGVAGAAGLDHWNDPTALWNDPTTLWVGPAWNEIACDVTAVSLTWGVDEATGAIASPAAGQWQLATYDPDRELDPSNDSSPYASMLVPRTPIRLVSPGGATLGTAFLDVVEHSEYEHVGHLEAIDAIGELAGNATSEDFAPFPPGVPWTFGALVWAVLDNVGLIPAISIGSSVPAPGSTADPLIAPRGTTAENAWGLIRDAAQDCLLYLWIDETGAIEVTAYGAIVDSGTILGDGGVCLSDLSFARSASGIVNRVDDATGQLAYSGPSAQQYGDARFAVDRREPGGSTWGAAILSDRAFASRVMLPVEALPTTEAELLKLRDLRGLGVRVKVNGVTPVINQYGQAVGGSLAAEGGGVWRGSVRVEQPASTFAYSPPSLALPRPTKSRRADCAGATMIGITPAGVQVGQDKQNAYLMIRGNPLNAGDSEQLYRSRVLADAPFDWTGVRRFLRCVLTVWLFATPIPNPATVIVSRVIGSWSEGSINWPGPIVDGTQQATFALTVQGYQSLDVTDLVWPIVPVALGGYGLPNMGLRLALADEVTHADAQLQDVGAGAFTYTNNVRLDYDVWE